MLIQQDWLMRQIEMIVSMVMRLLLKEKSQEADRIEVLSREGSAGLEKELDGLLREGRLGEAEDLLFLRLDPEDKSVLVTALAFYQRANEMTDEELAAQDFTREELLEGLGQVVERYGLCLPGFWENP